MEAAVRCGFHDCKSHIKSELPAEQAKRDLVSLQLASSLGWYVSGFGNTYCPSCIGRIAVSVVDGKERKLGEPPPAMVASYDGGPSTRENRS
jgi:hypothetical protein